MATINEKSHGMQITIAEVSKLESVYTSEVFVHGIPWRVKIFKDDTDEGSDESEDSDSSDDEEEDNANSWLAVRLICANKDKSLRWSIAGAVSFKLLSSTAEANVHEVNCAPSVYNCMSMDGLNFYRLIRWNDLFDKNNAYVKGDAIELEIKVRAENLNDPSRSRIELKYDEEGCNCGSAAAFRLIVRNISNLMAVRAPRFDLRGLSWNIVVARAANTDALFAQLYFDELTNEISCPVKWSIKLLSSKLDVTPIEKIQTESVLKSTDCLTLADIVSWRELFKPENAYVNNDAIALEIDIETYKPRGKGAKALSNAKRTKFSPEYDAGSLRLECPVCLKCIGSQELAVTPCGHMFCFECIQKVVAIRAACPSCNRPVRANSLLPIFLPTIN